MFFEPQTARPLKTAAYFRPSLGGATGYTRTTLNGASSASGESDNYHLSLYGGKRFDSLSLRIGAASTWHDQATSRSVVYAQISERQKAQYTSRTDQVFAEANYNRWENVEPFVNLNQVNFKSDSFNEHGGKTSLHSSAQTQSATFSTLGVRGQMHVPIESVRAVTLRGELGWQHQFGNRDRDTSLKFAGSDTAFTINSVPVSRDGALLKASAEIALSKDTSISLNYSGIVSGSENSHGMNAGVAFRF